MGKKDDPQRLGWRYRRTTEIKYHRIKLECTCWMKIRDRPFPNATFTCTSGLQHGSNLRWSRAVAPDGKINYNRLGPEAHLHAEAVAARAREKARLLERQAAVQAKPRPPVAAVKPKVPRSRGPATITVLLVCGCVREERSEPFPNQFFPCPRRKKHGLSVQWRQAETGDRLMVNTAAPPATITVSAMPPGAAPADPPLPQAKVAKQAGRRIAPPPKEEINPPVEEVLPRRKWRDTDRIKVYLECGCVRLEPMPPRNQKQRFVCNSGLQHGYRLRWIKHERRPGWVCTNPEFDN